MSNTNTTPSIPNANQALTAAILGDVYNGLTEAEREWADCNWKSMMNALADDLEEKVRSSAPPLYNNSMKMVQARTENCQGHSGTSYVVDYEKVQAKHYGERDAVDVRTMPKNKHHANPPTDFAALMLKWWDALTAAKKVTRDKDCSLVNVYFCTLCGSMEYCGFNKCCCHGEESVITELFQLCPDEAELVMDLKEDDIAQHCTPMGCVWDDSEDSD